MPYPSKKENEVDNTIISLFFERSETAISALAETYGDRCNSIAMKILGNRQDAEEVINDSYLKVWNHIPPRKPNPLSSYVFRIVRNLSINKAEHNTAQKRGRGFSVNIEELGDCVSSKRDNVETLLEAKEIAKYIDSFIDTLNRQNRLLFVRRYWYLDTMSELSSCTGMSEGAIRTRLSRIRKELKMFLERNGIEI